MDSRFNIPAPALVKLESDVDAEKQLAIESASPCPQGWGTWRLRPKRIVQSGHREKLSSVPRVARTVNRHRWVGRVYPGA